MAAERKGDFIYIDGEKVFAPAGGDPTQTIHLIRMRAAKLLAAGEDKRSDLHKEAANKLESRAIT